MADGQLSPVINMVRRGIILFVILFALCACFVCRNWFVNERNSTRHSEDAATSRNDRIVGVWEVIEGYEPLPKGPIYEFSKDGRLHITILGEQHIQVNGSYKLDGSKLTMTLRAPIGPDRSVDYYITEMTTDTLSLLVNHGAKGSETWVFKRIPVKEPDEKNEAK